MSIREAKGTIRVGRLALTVYRIQSTLCYAFDQLIRLSEDLYLDSSNNFLPSQSLCVSREFQADFGLFC